MPPKTRLFLLCACMVLAPIAVAGDGRAVWAWKSASGTPAYADQGGLNATLTPSSPQAWLPSALAERDEVRDGSDYEVYATNRTGGPLEAALAPRNGAPISTSPRDLHQLLAPGQRALMARIETAQGHLPDYSITVVPGDPHAIPDEDVVYSLPLDESSPWQFGQAFHGGFSHNDEQNRYAIDLIVPEGTPVLAARDGVVMLAQSGYGQGGLNRQDATRANQVMILHDDGSMAVYAHLLQGSVGVQVGERVGVGHQLALSGNSGYSSGPHLHFCLQLNTGMKLSSIPFRMVTSRGFLPLTRK